ncbi:alpha-galactosidase [candidate division KSB1 bacterium]|nr:alpha-galactosidase [candidate division KSB1 bacterium]
MLVNKKWFFNSSYYTSTSFKTFILIITILLFGHYPGYANKTPGEMQNKVVSFNLHVPASTQPVIISNADVQIKNNWASPLTNLPVSKNNEWKHTNREEIPKVLAKTPGTLIRDVFVTESLSLTREVWISSAKDEISTRQRLHNISQKPVYLKSLFPVLLAGRNSLQFQGESDAGNWDIMIQERLKNGHPRVVHPGENDKFEIDPFCLIHPEKSRGNTVLLIGYLSQTGHCARINLQFEQEQPIVLKELLAECEFDSCLVPPDGERTSQWVFIKLAADPNRLIKDYADKVGLYHGIKEPPRSAPSVFCSWYFHGPQYNEEYFYNDLNDLKKEHMPFDVFLIDECWGIKRWGDFTAIETWTRGMKDAADRIRALGYIPGIWSCPYLVDFNSNLAAQHPEWLLKDKHGERILFRMNDLDHWVLDTTFPGVCDYLEEAYRKLSDDWGYEYFKFDFMRAIFLDKGQRFFDPYATRLEAYRMGLEAIRRGVGPDAYISVCGGHYGGSLGLANSQRSGSDVVSIWRSNEIPKFRQNILRTWMSRLWHVDADAMMVRRREEKFHSDRELSLGLLTDQEANTIALNQYIGGGLVTFSEYLCELDADRKALYRHIIPSINSPSDPIDAFNLNCPTQMLTRIEPVCNQLDSWVTLSVVNWSDDPKTFNIVLSEEFLKTLNGERFLIFEFFEQKLTGLYKRGDTIAINDIAPHTSKLLRIAAWDGNNPILVGTDLHFSGGGVEISRWNVKNNYIEGAIDTQWLYPVTVSAVFPARNADEFILQKITVQPGQRNFRIDYPQNIDTL